MIKKILFMLNEKLIGKCFTNMIDLELRYLKIIPIDLWIEIREIYWRWNFIICEYLLKTEKKKTELSMIIVIDLQFWPH